MTVVRVHILRNVHRLPCAGCEPDAQAESIVHFLASAKTQRTDSPFVNFGKALRDGYLVSYSLVHDLDWLPDFVLFERVLFDTRRAKERERSKRNRRKGNGACHLASRYRLQCTSQPIGCCACYLHRPGAVCDSAGCSLLFVSLLYHIILELSSTFWKNFQKFELLCN